MVERRELGEMEDLDLLATFGPWQDQEVVDVGCGTGELVRGLAEWGATVLGVEPNAEQRRAALEAGVPPGCTIVDGGAESLPLGTDMADVVVFNRSLHHVPIPKMDAALKEALRVLGPGGQLFVLEPDIRGALSQLMLPFHDETEVRAAALAALERLGEPSLRLAYDRVHRFDSLEAFRERFGSRAFIQIDQDGLYSDTVAERFAAGVDGDGFQFANPIEVFGFEV